MSEETSRRCSFCNLNWPHTPDFKTCPLCHESTWQAAQPPMNADQALELMAVHKVQVLALEVAAVATQAQQDFEEYYVAKVTGTIDEEWARFGAV